MDKNLISIIVPVYNTEKYLPKCINSLLNQSYKNIEIIFVDDGSTDNSLEILENYRQKDMRIKIVSQNNQGVSEARNCGLKEAQGDFILFVDSDDWIDSDTCEVALKAIRQQNADLIFWSYKREYGKESKTTQLFGNEIVIWDKEEIKDLYRRFIGLIDSELSEPQKIDSIITVWGKLYRSNCIKDAIFVDTKIIGTAEDALFNIEVLPKMRKAIYLPDLYYHYRKDNDNSLTRNYKKELTSKWKNLYGQIYKNIQKVDGKEECYVALENRICLALIGLGLNLIEDSGMSFFEKRSELIRILNMQHYKQVLEKLKFPFLPLHWKVFFLCAKHRLTSCLCIMLYVMNFLRGK